MTLLAAQKGRHATKGCVKTPRSQVPEKSDGRPESCGRREKATSRSATNLKGNFWQGRQADSTTFARTRGAATGRTKTRPEV